MVRRLFLAAGLLVLSLWASVGAEFKLTNGQTLIGEPLMATANDQGLQIKVGEGQFQKVSWSSFSQEDLKNFAKNAKLEPFVEPFIEVDRDAKIRQKDVNIKEPPKLPQPARQSLFGALFSSSFGFFMVFLLYAANLYAAYEVALFRAQPPALVCGLAAIPGLGLLATITFLCLPTKLKPSEAPPEEVVEPGAEAAPAAAAAGEDVNPMLAEGAAHPGGLKLAHETVTYQRGQFTFNRRFFETKFPGFFGVVRRDADKDMVLVIKSTRGEFQSQRISRIAANDLHLQVQRGPTTEEVLVPFQEIQEIRLKHKDA
jgi:hypothetical protein